MNVTRENLDAVSFRLTVSVTEADYKEKVEKELKKVGKTITLPGFRKGHVPFSELKRRFNNQVTSDVINDEVYKAVTEYLKENNVSVLGEPIPAGVVELDLKNKTDYDFTYEIATAPEINITLDKDVHFPYYTIAVDDTMVAEQDAMLTKRFGAQVPGEEFEPDALVKGSIMELNEDGTVKEGEDAIQVISGIVAPMYFKSKEEADKFVGKKVGDKVVFNPAATCDGDPTEMSSMLQIDKDQAANVKSDFEMSISEIIVVRPAEHNQEFFDNVFGPDKVHNEEEYTEALRQIIAQQLRPNSENMFRNSVHTKYTTEFADMQLPVETLKKWLVRRNDGITEENVDEQMEKMLPDLRWQLVKERLAELTGIKIEEEDIKNYARAMAAQQFAQYGMTNMGDDIIDRYAQNLLEDKNYRQQIIGGVGDNKLFDAIKEHVTIDSKLVSLDEFKDLAKQAQILAEE
ncbi:MAG: trigger factor [Muribaculaceae bacterium]|nr:trigger factor [Muribaculaceae bacterium]